MENCKTPLPYFESYDNIIFVSCRHVGMADEADSKSVVGNHVWVQVPLPALKNLDFTGFARLSFQKVIKKVIKCISDGIPIEKCNKMKEEILYI